MADRCKTCGRIIGRAQHTCQIHSLKYFVRKFWSLVKKTRGCWIWQGELNARGYGRTYLGGGRRRRKTLAHRFAWELKHGPIPQGKLILHNCDIRRCVRDDHLFPGTHKDNSADMSRKGRQWLQKAPRSVQLASAAHMRAGKG